MSDTARREFLKASSLITLSASLSGEMFAQASHAKPTPNAQWDPGVVRHILPAVNATQMLIKISLAGSTPTSRQQRPVLQIDGRQITGDMTDTKAEHWRFFVDRLNPNRTYTLSLTDGRGRALCQPWPLATFPAPTDKAEHCRLLIFSCAGGHEMHQFLPITTRRRMLQRGLSFKPHAMIANGDHVYWDLQAPVGSKTTGATAQAIALTGPIDRAQPVLGTTTEDILKKVVSPQIIPLYGTDFRSTPVYFLQDDHDYFDNDEATDDIVTFPPSYFMLQLARATQSLYYPEFLADERRPGGLPWSNPADRTPGISESFGTLRYGALAELLLYDVRRSMTMAGPSAVFVDPQVEAWLVARMADAQVRHTIHIPSNPPGWTAGKWGEWYPDYLGADGKLDVSTPKPYWQTGWLKQHDRIMASMSGNRSKIPLVISGDLHATAIGSMTRTGKLDFSAHPVNIVLPGPIGTREAGWTSARRGTGAKPSKHLDMSEAVAPIEQHGFTIVDLTSTSIKVQMFKWDIRTQALETIDTLEPFHVSEFVRQT